MKIDIKLIKTLEEDAMFDFTDEELSKILKMENNMLEKFEKVKNINTEGVEELHYPFEIESTYLRDDSETSSISKSAILANAPSCEGDFITIVRVVK